MQQLRLIPLLLVLSLSLSAAVPKGTHIDTLPAGKRTYTDVTVRSVNAVTVMITHSEGLASVPLKDLTPEWQARFDYNPTAAAQTIAATKSKPAAVAAAHQAPAPPSPSRVASPQATTPLEDMLLSLSQAPELKPLVDLRGRFFDYGLYPKNQGRRPSCSVFAVVSALEFQNATLLSQPEKFSEEYLIWATRKVLGRVQTVTANTTDNSDAESDADEGFSLADVVTALRTYGVPRQVDMPNTFGSSMRDIPEPDAKLIERARSQRLVSIYRIPGQDTAEPIVGLIKALNAGVPPVIGLAWPHQRSIQNGFLARQQPVTGYAHAITLVGYRCETGKLEDVIFIFKNSWGPRWGQGGFGNVTYNYLLKNLQVAVVLDVQTAR